MGPERRFYIIIPRIFRISIIHPLHPYSHITQLAFTQPQVVGLLLLIVLLLLLYSLPVDIQRYSGI